MNREKAIDYIEGMVGLYTAEWNKWPDEDIKKLYIFVCVSDHEKLSIEDIERIGFTLR